MYYKNYGINGELEKMYNDPVNKVVSLDENRRIIKLYRAFLLKNEKVMFECSGLVPKEKRKHTKILKRYFDVKSILLTAVIIAAIAAALLMLLSESTRTVLLILLLAFPVVYTIVVNVYWRLIDDSPDLEAIGKIKYLITDRRIIARHKDDVDITDNVLQVKSAGLVANELDRAVSVTVRVGAESVTVSYSPLTYMMNKANAENGATRDLVRALHAYYLAAAAYAV